jgi:hypothetical protein
MSEASDVCFHVNMFFVACNKLFFYFFPGTMVCKLAIFNEDPLLEVDFSVNDSQSSSADDSYLSTRYDDFNYSAGNLISGYI